MSSSNTDEIVNQLKDDFESLAQELRGEPNRSLSSAHNWRYGFKGSLSVDVGPGPKCGSYFDHEGQTGGGPIQLIQHVLECSVAEAFEYAKAFLGLKGDIASPRPRPETSQRRKVELDTTRTDHAMAMWAGTVPLAGTIAERYLTENRGVPVEFIADLDQRVRFHPAYRASTTARGTHPALIALATDSADSSCGIQAVRLQANGRKFAGPVPKLSNGILNGAAVRLPGIGELILIEGPEKGIVAWAATGRPVWIALGSLSKVASQVPDGTSVTLSRDQDKPDSPAAKAFEATCNALVACGCRVSVACPPVAADGNKFDWDDLARRDGIAAVQKCFATATPWVTPEATPLVAAPQTPKPISPAPDPNAPTVDEVREMVSVAICRFADQALKYHAALARYDGDVSDRRMGITPTGDAMAELIPPKVPVVAIDAPTGIGKSTLVRDQLIRRLRDAYHDRPVVVMVPTIKLADEATESAIAGGLSAMTYRGRDRCNPDGVPMCSDLKAVADAMTAGEPIQSTVCENKFTKTQCKNFASCLTQKQRREAKDVDVIFMAHQFMFMAKEVFIKKPSCIIIDESFLNAGLLENPRIVLCDILGRSRDVFGTDDNGVQHVDISATFRLEDWNRQLAVAMASCDGPLTAEALGQAGINTQLAAEAGLLVWKTAQPSGIMPGMEAAERSSRAKLVGENNSLVTKYAKLWSIVRDMLKDGADHTAWINCQNIKADDGNTSGAKMKYRKTIKDGWNVPTLILDATFRKEVVEPFFTNVEVVSMPYPATPFQKVVQILCAPVSKNKLSAKESRGAKYQKTAKNHQADLARYIEIKASQHKTCLVICQIELEDELKKIGLPSNVDINHFNNVRGIDGWKFVDYFLVIHQTLPTPDVIEAIAESLTGRSVTPVGRWYPKADGGSEYHPDKTAEDCRWSVCEAEIGQVIGRGRGINRTSENPVLIEVMNNLELPLPVAETRQWQAPTFAETMLARGVVPTDWIGRARVVGDMLEDVTDPADTLTSWFRKNPVEAKKLSEAIECPSFSYKREYSIGERRTFAPFTYRIAGNRKSATIAISKRFAPDYRQAAEKWLGTLDTWEPLAEFPALTQKVTAAVATAEVQPVAEQVAAVSAAVAEAEPVALVVDAVAKLAAGTTAASQRLRNAAADTAFSNTIAEFANMNACPTAAGTALSKMIDEIAAGHAAADTALSKMIDEIVAGHAAASQRLRNAAADTAFSNTIAEFANMNACPTAAGTALSKRIAEFAACSTTAGTALSKMIAEFAKLAA